MMHITDVFAFVGLVYWLGFWQGSLAFLGIQLFFKFIVHLIENP